MMNQMISVRVFMSVHNYLWYETWDQNWEQVWNPVYARLCMKIQSRFYDQRQRDGLLSWLVSILVCGFGSVLDSGLESCSAKSLYEGSGEIP